MLTLAWKCRRCSTVSMHLDPTETVASCKDNAQWGLPVLIVRTTSPHCWWGQQFYLFFMDSSWEQRCTLDLLILDFSSAIHTIQPIIISQCQILILILDWLKLVGFFCFFFNSQGKTVSFPPGCVLSPSLNILYTNDCRDKHKKRHLHSPFSLLQEGEVEPHLKLNLRETLTLHPSHHH